MILRMTEADVFGIDSGFGNFKYTSTNDCCLHVRTWTHFQGTYSCHVPGHICLLSPLPEECLKVGECLFVIARTMPLSCLHILGADFPSLVNYVLAQKRLRCGVINRESCFLRTSGPPTDCQVSESEMHFLDFIHSLWKAQKWAFNVKNIIKDICNTATLPLPSKRKKWLFSYLIFVHFGTPPHYLGL